MQKSKLFTQYALAKRFGKSQAKINGYRKRDWWTWGDGPWTEAQAKQIERAIKALPPSRNDADLSPVAETVGSDGGSDDPLDQLRNLGPVNRAKLQLVIERSTKIRLERELLAGQYLKRAEVEQAQVGKVHAVRTAMLSVADSGIVDSIRNAENGEDAKEMLRGRMIEICQEFSRE